MLTPYLATFVTQTKFAAEIEMSPKLTRVFRRRRIFTKERSDLQWRDFMKTKHEQLIQRHLRMTSLDNGLVSNGSARSLRHANPDNCHEANEARNFSFEISTEFFLLEFGWLSLGSLIFFGWSCRILLKQNLF